MHYAHISPATNVILFMVRLVAKQPVVMTESGPVKKYLNCENSSKLQDFGLQIWLLEADKMLVSASRSQIWQCICFKEPDLESNECYTIIMHCSMIL